MFNVFDNPISPDEALRRSKPKGKNGTRQRLRVGERPNLRRQISILAFGFLEPFEIIRGAMSRLYNSANTTDPLICIIALKSAMLRS